MKGLSIVGIILLVISGVLFYFSTDFVIEKITISHVMGIMGGVGIGLIIGGIVGYISKGDAVKQAEIKKRIDQLQDEKYQLQQKVNQQNNSNNNPLS